MEMRTKSIFSIVEYFKVLAVYPNFAGYEKGFVMHVCTISCFYAVWANKYGYFETD